MTTIRIHPLMSPLTPRVAGIAALVALTTLGPLSGSASAQTASAPAASGQKSAHPIKDKFDLANTTHDGHLTLAQAQAGNMPMVAHQFSAIDTDHKGYVTLQNIQQFVRARQAAHKAQSTATPPS